jgi:DNA-binding transcriptional MerR regulator
MRIGEIARRTGASQKAIRLYESLGLLGRVQRSGVYRSYSEANVRQVQMIRSAQTLGFSLSELKSVLRPEQGAPGWSVLLQQLDLKRQSMRVEIERLQQLEKHVVQIIAGIQVCAAAHTSIDFARCNPLGSPVSASADVTT